MQPDGIVRNSAMVSASADAFQLLLGRLAAIAIGGVAGEGDFLQRHLGRQLVLQAVGVNEDAVVLFLQPLHFLGHAAPMRAQAGVRALQRLGAVVRREQRKRGEIPRGFVGVPVGTGFSNKLLYC